MYANNLRQPLKRQKQSITSKLVERKKMRESTFNQLKGHKEEKGTFQKKYKQKGYG